MLLIIGGMKVLTPASSPGPLEDPSPKQVQETLKLSERAKPPQMPISACDLDFASGVLPHRRLHLQENARMATMSVRQWLGTRSTPAKMAGLRETLSHPLTSRAGSQQCAPSEQWGPRQTSLFEETSRCTRCTTTTAEPPASIAYPGRALVSTIRPHMATEEALAASAGWWRTPMIRPLFCMLHCSDSATQPETRKSNRQAIPHSPRTPRHLSLFRRPLHLAPPAPA
jgi:hypothetical protein